MLKIVENIDWDSFRSLLKRLGFLSNGKALAGDKTSVYFEGGPPAMLPAVDSSTTLLVLPVPQKPTPPKKRPKLII